MKNTADYTRLLLLQKYGAEVLKKNADTILKSLQEGIAVDATPSTTAWEGFPLPHGSEYDSLQELVKDVKERCAVEKCSVKVTENLLGQVLTQYTMQEFIV